MNTWMVGRHPIAHEKHAPRYVSDTQTGEGGQVFRGPGAHVFYLKGRIMAGQADITGNKLGLTDFKWLTKDELQEHLQPLPFRSVQYAMPSR